MSCSNDTIIINDTNLSENLTINTSSNVVSVNNKIGVVVLNQADIGLDQVNNTSDLNKPISLATSSALNSLTSTTFGTLSSLSYSNTNISENYLTLGQYVSANTFTINKGSTITLNDGRIYIFAGTNSKDPTQYLEVNSNPITPIYQQVSLNSGNSVMIDSFALSEYKSAKYTLQIETTFNNDIYYSEINVVGSVASQTAVASEYGQISTSDIIVGYQAIFNINQVDLFLYYNTDPVLGHNIIVKGHRTNFFKI